MVCSAGGEDRRDARIMLSFICPLLIACSQSHVPSIPISFSFPVHGSLLKASSMLLYLPFAIVGARTQVPTVAVFRSVGRSPNKIGTAMTILSRGRARVGEEVCASECGQ